MRTTIEISSDQHRALSAMAQQRGLRGFSLLVQEAVDAYLHDNADDEIAVLLGLEGSLTDEEADEAERRLAQARATWRAS